MASRFRISLAAALWLVAASVGAKFTHAAEIPDGLQKYVSRPETVYRWELLGKTTQGTSTIYDLHLVSQDWQGIVWEHQLQVYQTENAKPAETMLVWNQGGRASEGSIAFGLELARKIGTPVGFLYGVPKQPLFDGKKEDTLIAETFVRYLETKDEAWPLLFPMVKSVVKAMDALQEFSDREWKLPVKKFVISVASKRGWTTWLTAASDARVKAIAPLVIDTLNMREQTPYQFMSFGHYSEQIRDYTARGLVPMPDTPEAKRLWSMVDPWADDAQADDQRSQRSVLDDRCSEPVLGRSAGRQVGDIRPERRPQLGTARSQWRKGSQSCRQRVGRLYQAQHHRQCAAETQLETRRRERQSSVDDRSRSGSEGRATVGRVGTESRFPTRPLE